MEDNFNRTKITDEHKYPNFRKALLFEMLKELARNKEKFIKNGSIVQETNISTENPEKYLFFPKIITFNL